MSNNNICVNGDVSKLNNFWLKDVPYLELWPCHTHSNYLLMVRYK